MSTPKAPDHKAVNHLAAQLDAFLTQRNPNVAVATAALVRVLAAITTHLDHPDEACKAAARFLQDEHELAMKARSEQRKHDGSTP